MSAPIEINLNGYVTVFPNSDGWNLIRAYYAKLGYLPPNEIVAIMESRTVSGDVHGAQGYRDQFHVLINIFGGHLYGSWSAIGAIAYFEPLNVYEATK